MANVTNYKCPACTGPLHFASKSGLLECDYCGSKFEVSQIDEMYSDKVKEEAKTEVETNASSEQIKSLSCPSCGAELICDETTVATHCPYCGNPTVIASQFKGGRMPDYVIPFKVDKNTAIQSLKNFYKKKIFLPKVFASQNHIEEIKGVYVPFWLFSGISNASVELEATREHTTTSGDETIKKTEYYQLFREGSIPYWNVPVDASAKMDDKQMDSIEPFDFQEMKEYTSSYLPGYIAESFDVTPEECFERCKLRVANTTVSTIAQTAIGYDSVSVRKQDVILNNEKTSYVFIPVWLLTTKWNDSNFLFAMNGQTGKFVGKLPVDKGKVAGFIVTTTLVLTAIITAISMFF